MQNLPLHPPIGPGFPWLAPLAGHSDLALRVLCREQGAAVACTEMVSAKGLVYGAENRKPNSGTEDLLLTTPLAGFPASPDADQPLVVQLFGEDASFLGRAVRLLKERGFAYFDLNLGCSVPKVVKTGAGAALPRSLDATLAAAEAMLKEADGRVGFKIRLGWNAAEENYLELGQALERAGAAWLTLHPRYARQGFTGDADWSKLARLKECVRIPVMASGDLFDAASSLRCLRESGVDGLMFARGALNNPAIFSEYLQALQSNLKAGPETGQLSANASPDTSEIQPDPLARATKLRAIVLRHAKLAQALPEPPVRKKRGEDRPAGSLLKMRGAIPRYIKDLPGSRALRVSLASCTSWDEFYQLAESYFDGLERELAAHRMGD